MIVKDDSTKYDDVIKDKNRFVKLLKDKYPMKDGTSMHDRRTIKRPTSEDIKKSVIKRRLCCRL
jgi:hypothetical protein